MTDERIRERIEELEALYLRRWGKEPALVALPPQMTQERYVRVLEHIAETGESVLVGWQKCFAKKQGNNE